MGAEELSGQITPTIHIELLTMIQDMLLFSQFSAKTNSPIEPRVLVDCRVKDVKVRIVTYSRWTPLLPVSYWSPQRVTRFYKEEAVPGGPGGDLKDPS